MPVSHMPQTIIRIGPEPSRKLNIAIRIDRIGWDCMMLAILQYWSYFLLQFWPIDNIDLAGEWCTIVVAFGLVIDH